MDAMKETEVFINIGWIRLSLRFLLIFCSANQSLLSSRIKTSLIVFLVCSNNLSLSLLTITITTSLFPGKCISRTRITLTFFKHSEITFLYGRWNRQYRDLLTRSSQSKKCLKTLVKHQTEVRRVFLQKKMSHSSFVYNPGVSYRNGQTQPSKRRQKKP